MNQNPDPTLHELEARAKLAAGRLEAVKTALEMERENFKELIKLARESREKINELRASLEGLTMDVEDTEADAAWEQMRVRARRWKS